MAHKLYDESVRQLCFVFSFFMESELELNVVELRSQYYYKYVKGIWYSTIDEKEFSEAFFRRFHSMKNFPPVSAPRGLQYYWTITRYLFYRAKVLNLTTIEEFLLLDFSSERVHEILSKVILAVYDRRLEEPASYDWDYDYTKDPVTFEDLCVQNWREQKKKDMEVAKEESVVQETKESKKPLVAKKPQV